MRFRATLAGLLFGVAATGCSRNAPSLIEATSVDSAPPAKQAVQSPENAPNNTVTELTLRQQVPIDEVVDVGNALPVRPFNDVLAHTIADNQQWWAEQFPRLYGLAYTPVTGGIYADYPARDTPIPGCNGQSTTSKEELASLIAFYCADGDFFAFDDSDTSELVLLTQQNGPAVVSLIVSHEWAHAIQSRAGVFENPVDTIYTEQQADCFAGAWSARAYRGESPFIQLSDADLRTALMAMLSVRDPIGVSQFDDGGHGSAFDRIGAFQEGFLDGPGRCVSMIDEPLSLVPNEFEPNSVDQVNGGNAPFSCDGQTPTCAAGPEILAADLNEFWRERITDFPTLAARGAEQVDARSCDDLQPIDEIIGLCPSSAAVVYDAPEIRKLYDAIGDFSLAYYYAIAWSEMALQLSGDPSTGESRALLRDCMAGLWIADIIPNEHGSTRRDGVEVSPGDLDETVRVILSIGDPASDTDINGSPFEIIAALRTGVFDRNCTAYGG